MTKVAKHSSNLNQSPRPVSLLALSQFEHVSQDYWNESNFSFCKFWSENMKMIFKVALFCAERKLKRRAAYQGCPAEARRTLHLHGTDPH